MEQGLPPSLNNLVSEYQDEKTYRQNINTTNPLARSQILSDELAGIDLNDVIQFKLANQLADNYIDVNYKYDKSKPARSTVASIFLQMLNIYTYDDLLDPKKIIIHDEIEDIVFDNLYQYISRFINDQRALILDSLNDKEYILSKLSPRVVQKLKDSDVNPDDYYSILTDAYDNMLNNKDVKFTISWEHYLPLFESYIEAVININQSLTNG